MPDLDLRGYLRRLGVDDPGAASPPSLARLHRAHVDRIPYTTLDIHLGRATTVDPYESADRVVRTGRAGYCFHNNGALAALLGALGYDVRWHVGAVQGRGTPAPPGRTADHLALTVHGLPDDAAPDGVWLVDAGLGDALVEPVPLAPAAFTQGPLTLRLRPSAVAPDGWRLDHDPLGSFAGMDFWPEPAGPADFVASHARLSTSPTSGFVRTLVVSRHTGTEVLVVRGCTLTVVGAVGRVDHRDLVERGEWFGTVVDRLGLALDDVSAEERDALWTRVRRGHDDWVAAGRP